MVGVTREQAGECHNCQSPLVGAFCHACGQEAGPALPTLHDLMRDVYDEFLKLDSRVPSTLRLLLTQPGEITVRYAAGQRTRFVAPFKLYFATSFLFFFEMSLSKASNLDAYGATIDNAQVASVVSKSLEFYMDHFATFSIVLLPIGALTQAVLFWRSRPNFVFHLVSNLHNLSAGYLIYLPILPLAYLATFLGARGSVFSMASGIYLVVYMVYQTLALRRTYRQSMWVTVGKVILVNMTTMFISFVSMLAIVIYFAMRARL